MLDLVFTGAQFSGSQFDMERPYEKILQQIHKLECVQYIADFRNQDMCACGQERVRHSTRQVGETAEVWSPISHTISSPSDAYGTIQFDGDDPNKARYIRLSSRTQLDVVVQLMIDHWQVKKPKLVISIRGGRPNFKLNPELKKLIRTGLVGAAQSTGKMLMQGVRNS